MVKTLVSFMVESWEKALTDREAWSDPCSNGGTTLKKTLDFFFTLVWKRNIV